MWVILDHESDKYIEGHGNRPSALEFKQLASLIIRVNDDGTYSVIKDRIKGEMHTVLPIDELPAELKTRMAELLRWKDGVDIDE